MVTYTDGYGLWCSTAQHHATAKKEIVHELATRLETHNRPYAIIKRDLNRTLTVKRCPICGDWKEVTN